MSNYLGIFFSISLLVSCIKKTFESSNSGYKICRDKHWNQMAVFFSFILQKNQYEKISPDDLGVSQHVVLQLQSMIRETLRK